MKNKYVNIMGTINLAYRPSHRLKLAPEYLSGEHLNSKLFYDLSPSKLKKLQHLISTLLHVKDSRHNSIQITIKTGLDKGYHPIINKGCSRSVIYKNSEGKNFGIFKPKNGTYSLLKKIKLLLAYIFGIRDQDGYLPLPKDRHHASMISERVCYLLDEVIETGLNPKTEIIEVDGSKGSFQHFVHGYEEAEKVQFPTDPNEQDLDNFQHLAILDFLQGNLDRKLDNWMVKLTEDQQHFEDIKAIDNANCFPRGHLPESSRLFGLPISFDHSRKRIDFAHKKQYQWKELPIAQEPLTQNSKKLIDSLTDEKVQEVIEKWKLDLKEKDFEAFFGGTDGEAIKAFKDRVAVLHHFAKTKANKPFSQLGSYNSYSTIQKCLGDNIQAAQAIYLY